MKDPEGETVVIDDNTAILVRDAVMNEDYKPVTTAPQSGEYKVDTEGGEFIFSDADKWLKRLLFLDGNPVTLEQICEWDWDIANIGRWLDLVVQMSG